MPKAGCASLSRPTGYGLHLNHASFIRITFVVNIRLQGMCHVIGRIEKPK
jgi:hypothetical protein